MDRQLVDFLGTWKSPEASARYFRGDPRAVILMVRIFYLQSDPFRKAAMGGISGWRNGCTGATIIPCPLRDQAGGEK